MVMVGWFLLIFVDFKVGYLLSYLFFCFRDVESCWVPREVEKRRRG